MFAKKIEIALVKTDMKKIELANRIGISTQNLYKRMKTDNMTEETMKQISEALGGELILKIKLKNGEEI